MHGGAVNDAGHERLRAIEAEIAAVQEAVAMAMVTPIVLRQAVDLQVLERERGALCGRLADLLAAQSLQGALLGEAMRSAEDELIRSVPKKYQSEGWREVTLRFAQGHRITVMARYFRQKARRRRRGGYPGLLLLGIHDRCTPTLAAEVSRLATALGSFDEARQDLRGRGIELDCKTVRPLTRRLASRARVAQQAQQTPLGQRLCGCRVVVSSDGGRMRIRRRKRGRHTAKGRARYRGDWHEPKLLMIYVVDQAGRLEQDFTPWIDGTLCGPQAVFGLIAAYLRRLGVTEADRVLFVADGAHWIWLRIAALVRALGLRPEQVEQLIDCYHAVQHLGEIVRHCTHWTEAMRRAWLKDQRRNLLQGQLGRVLDAMASVCCARHTPELIRARLYFQRNRARMAYARLSEQHWPIGSGAMESAMRRVVNLRLKGNGIFWNRETAEEMLMLRSYYKAGHWDTLTTLAFTPSLAA
jgi:hypothetical protein